MKDCIQVALEFLEGRAPSTVCAIGSATLIEEFNLPQPGTMEEFFRPVDWKRIQDEVVEVGLEIVERTPDGGIVLRVKPC